VGNEIQVLLELDDSPIAIYNGMHMGLSFHPELNGVTLFHDSLFRGLVNSNFQASGNINAA
jgi:glutamine amidotransferase PdxT